MTYAELSPLISGIELGTIVFLFWKRGTYKAATDLIDLQEKQINTLIKDAEISRQHGHDLGNQIQGLSLKVGKMEGQLSEKQRQIDDYKAIFENRDPQLITVLGEIKDFMKLMAQRFDEHGAVQK